MRRCGRWFAFVGWLRELRRAALTSGPPIDQQQERSVDGVAGLEQLHRGVEDSARPIDRGGDLAQLGGGLEQCRDAVASCPGTRVVSAVHLVPRRVGTGAAPTPPPIAVPGPCRSARALATRGEPP